MSDLYRPSSRNASSSSPNFSRAAPPTQSNHQQPSFPSSVSSLPGALGIGSSLSTALPGASRSNIEANGSREQHPPKQQQQHQHQRLQSDASSLRRGASPSTGSSSELYMTSPSSSRGLDSANMKDAGAESSSSNGAPDGFYQSRSVSSSSLTMDASGSSGGRRRAGSGSNPPSSRKFMIPIGATGARQKLNVLSASQKPRGSSLTSRRPSTSSSASHAGEEGGFGEGSFQRLGSSHGRSEGSSRGIGSFTTSQSHEYLPRPTSSSNSSSKGRNGAESDLTRDGSSSQRRPSDPQVNGWTLVSTTSPASAASPPSQATNRWSSASSANASPQPPLPVSGGWVMDPSSSTATATNTVQSQSSTPTQERPDPLMQRESSTSSMRSLGSWRKALNATPRREPSGKGVQPSHSNQSIDRVDPADPPYSSPKADAILGRQRSASNTSDRSFARSPQSSTSSKMENAAGKVRGGFRSLFQSKGSRLQSPPTDTPSQFSPPKGLWSPPDPPQDNSMYGSQPQRNNSAREFQTSESGSEMEGGRGNRSASDFGDSHEGDARSDSTEKDEKPGGEGASEDDREEDDESETYQERQMSPLVKRTSEFAPTLDLNLPSAGGLFDQSPRTEKSALLGVPMGTDAADQPRSPMDRGSGDEAIDLSQHASLLNKSLPPTPGPSSSNASSVGGDGSSFFGSPSAKTTPQKGASSWSQAPAAAASSAGSQRGSLLGLSPNGDSDRRFSTATVSSTATSDTPAGSLTTNKGLELTPTTPPDDGAATRSSRTLIPIDSDKPNVPLTSPLLAAVLDQQKRNASMATASSSHSPSPSSLIRGSVSSESASPSSRFNARSSQDSTPSPTRSSASASTNDTAVPNGGTPTKPGIPAKSKDRPSLPPQPDQATLARLERSAAANTVQTGAALSAAATAANTSATVLETNEDSTSAMAPPDATSAASRSSSVKSNENQSTGQHQASAQAKPAFDPATYVPPGALTRTRKGVTVLPLSSTLSSTSQRTSAGAQSSEDHSSRSGTAEDGDESTPRPSMDLGGFRTESAIPKHSNIPMPVSPTMRSRFSISGEEESGTHIISRPDPVEEGGSDGQIISFNSGDFDPDEDNASVDSGSMLPASAWAEVETSLQRFKDTTASTAADKGGLLRTILLPFLALEAETPNVEVSGEGNFTSGKARRSLFFEWIRHLLLELQTVQTSADRGAILESIACIIESRNFSASILSTDLEDETRFSSVFGHILSYAIGELNKKGVYQNTLIFSGRLLAVAFFRVKGVASKLLRALPVNRFALERVAHEAQWDVFQPKDWRLYASKFPQPLRDFCFQDAKTYLKMLDSQTTTAAVTNGDADDDDDRFLVRHSDVEVEMTGNWLRRWQSDDSELFFSFCRSYHRQLAGLFSASKNLEGVFKLFFGGPGYAHLATCIHQKCLSLVHRDILSVTTLSSQKNFNPGETANVLSGSTAGKPRHLEAANRRCSAIVVDIVRAPSSNNQIFAPMLGIHVKCLVRRTSLYDVQGVFCLLDWMDGVLSHMETAELPAEHFIDIDFLIHTVWLLLKDADHALALMRTVAFCYSNFAVLTSTSRHRTRFCEEILLDARIFQKLFLSWSFTIRAYFLHLLVFRLARINDFPSPNDDPNGKTAVIIARLFNMRLDEIRTRHDELSPSPSSADSGSEDDGEESSRSKGRPQSFVSTIRHTSSIHHNSESSLAVSKAERVLGIGMPDPVLSSGKGESKAQSRAAKWLRALGGRSVSKGSKNKFASASSSASPMPSMTENPLIYNEPRRPMPRVDEIDIDSEEDGSGSRPASPETASGDTPKADEGQFDFGSSSGNASSRQQATSSPTAYGENLAPDMAFDLQSPMATLPGERASTSRAQAHQPRISRAFSKRSSILPGPAFELVSQDDGKIDTAMEEEEAIRASTMVEPRKKLVKADPYDRKLHTYAVQSLREYEQTIQEHDEYFASQPEGEKAQVPKLPTQWPQMFADS